MAFKAMSPREITDGVSVGIEVVHGLGILQHSGRLGVAGDQYNEK